jgi:Ser/Thr protein kinase RdoA (MazF antagonist)
LVVVEHHFVQLDPNALPRGQGRIAMTGDALDLHEKATEIVAHFFKGSARIVPLPSLKNSVYRLGFEGGSEYKILKLAFGEQAVNVRREQGVLRALKQQGLPVPSIDFIQESWHDTAVAFTIMPELARCNLEQFAPSDPSLVKHAYRRSGEFLARLSGINPANVPEAHKYSGVSAWMRKELAVRKEVLDYGGLWRPEFELLWEKVNTLIDRSTGQLAHRDFNFGQVVVDELDGFGVVDWEEAGAGFPLLDCADFIKLAIERNIPAELRTCFIDGYRDNTPWSESHQNELDAWQGYSFLGAAEHYLRAGRESIRKAVPYVEWALAGTSDR